MTLLLIAVTTARASAQCGAWENNLGSSSSVVNAFATWDPDGSGPLNLQLVAAGTFATANRIASWNGAVWESFGTGMSSGVSALTTVGPDGTGPLNDQLVAGGFFTTAGGVTVNYIARWDGTAWQPFAMGMNSTVLALTTGDPDGTGGPLRAQVVAGGAFTTAGGVAANYVARWDGLAWRPFGTGVNNGVRAITTWDPDGTGPLDDQIVAGGYFTTASGGAASRIARWDGTAWRPLGTGMSGGSTPYVLALTTWDPDGAGPLNSQLVAGGLFTTAGGVTVNGIARWDGIEWRPFGAGMNGGVYALTTWDPDGPGPQNARLVAGGYFTTADGVVVNNIAQWNGIAWQPFDTGMSNGVTALATWDPDGAGPLSARLVAGGSFTTAGSVSANFLAVWKPSLPAVLTQPSSVDTCLTGTSTFSIAATGSGPISYRWRKNGNPIDVTTYPSAATAILSLSSITAADAAVYDCFVTDACGSVTSNTATLTVNATFPTITTQPESQSKYIGEMVTFEVSASGSPGASYQWRKNAGLIAGATATTYSIGVVSADSAGAYDCVVTNACGSVDSNAATLTVSEYPLGTVTYVAQNRYVSASSAFCVPGTMNTAPDFGPYSIYIAGGGFSGDRFPGYEVIQDSRLDPLMISYTGSVRSGRERCLGTWSYHYSTSALDVRFDVATTPVSYTAVISPDGDASLESWPSGTILFSGMGTHTGVLNPGMYRFQARVSAEGASSVTSDPSIYWPLIAGLGNLSATIQFSAACPCPADFDGSGGTPDAIDIDAFFTAWLAGDPVADTDCSGGTPDAVDIEVFFAAWLAGGC